MGQRIEILPGAKHDRLTVIKELPPRIRTNGNPRRMLLCKCDCGTIKEILFQSFTIGRVSSCGCLQVEASKNGKYAKKHGLSGHPLFTVWRCMMNRCYDKKHKGYKDYGGRGVVVCDEWKNNPNAFVDWALKNGWRKGLELDKDIKGNGLLYSSSTCLFVPHYVNLMNRRNTKPGKRICWNESIEYV